MSLIFGFRLWWVTDQLHGMFVFSYFIIYILASCVFVTGNKLMLMHAYLCKFLIFNAVIPRFCDLCHSLVISWSSYIYL